MAALGHNAPVGVERKIDAQLLAEALLQAPVAWSLFDLSGHGVAGSREYASVFELSPDDLIGLPFEAMIDPGDRGYTSTVLGQLARGDTEEYISIQPSQRPGGGEQLVRLSLRALMRDGEPVALFSTAVPITEAARFDAHRIQKLIENIDDTISLIDENGVLIETSGRYKPILGYPSEFWADRTIFDLLHPDDAVRVLALREEVVSNPGAVITGEFQVRAADDTYQPVQVHAVNLLHDPDVSGIVVTSRNISEMKELMRDLADNRDAALAEAALRTRLIATVSHELRNPLHAMCGLAELLTTSAGLSDDASTLAHTLRRQIEGLTTVIDDLLESSRLGVGAVALVRQPVVLLPLIDDVIAMAALGLRRAADERARRGEPRHAGRSGGRRRAPSASAQQPRRQRGEVHSRRRSAAARGSDRRRVALPGRSTPATASTTTSWTPCSRRSPPAATPATAAAPGSVSPSCASWSS